MSCTTSVPPQLESSLSLWDHQTHSSTQKFEGVQRRAARFVANNQNPTDSVTVMFDELGGERLQIRMQYA